MSSNWLTNFDLFLRTKGSDDVQLWRLKKFESLSSASSQIMRLTPDDFEYISEVKDHQKLIENMFQWNITDYKNLINYISTRRLLVNGEGMVIAEVLKYDEDGNELPAVYYRSRDVVSLNTYIPSIHKRRKVKDVVVAPPAVDKEKTLQDKLDKEKKDKQVPAKRVADLEAENKILAKRVADLEAENKTLKIDVTKLKTDLAARTNDIADEEVKNKTCETNVTKLKADLAARTNEIADLKAENKTLEINVTKLKADLHTKTNEIADLEAGNKTLETDVTKLKADLAARTNEIANLESKNKTLEGNVAKLTPDQSNAVTTDKEVWMNDFTDKNWVGIEGLMKATSIDEFTVVQKQGVFVTDDDTTNVRARYWFKIKVVGTDDKTFKAVDLQDLVPNKDKARFLQANWWTLQSEGKTYAFR